MDKKHFRINSDPLYGKAKVYDNKYSLPLDVAPDNRYPKSPAQMSDGRLVTDYANHCSQNIPAGSQFPTKQWLINNSEKIMEASRATQFPTTRPLDNSVIPPPSQIIECKKYECNMTDTKLQQGIGIERRTTTPDLFGTFNMQQFEQKPSNPMVTHYYEGGRNTTRGTYSNLQDIYNIKPRERSSK